jgi:hypothetical protein
MNYPATSKQQARSDERDNSRVFVFLIIAAIVVVAGALLYFFAVDKRVEGPAREATPPAAQMQGTVPGSASGAAPGSTRQDPAGSPAAPTR